jgi:hypothetical protein
VSNKKGDFKVRSLPGKAAKQSEKTALPSVKNGPGMSLALQKMACEAKMLRKLLARIQNALLLAFADPIKNNRFPHKQHLLSL